MKLVVLKSFILICILSAVVPSSAQEIQCQKLFISAQNEPAKQEFYNYCANLSNRNNTQQAYFGVATAMYAELVSNPADKLGYFSRGKDMLEKAIANDYWNEELRFLRYSVQDKAPWMLQYHDKLDEDAYYIYQSLSTGKLNKTKAFWKIVIQFMIQSKNISDDLKSKYSQL
ncbi:MAG: hypothetical protein NWQ44_09375 [Flavobacteriales bacterium]|jgi:hypothetical protein|nr:hypothetical protein [Flavobacteriales bacterium]MDP4731882.1 hypothetical protein [Flavobacteriales bacterium]MDP4818426.1 hypothetical protein [Flavobacteriales bacterium]MDP4951923.1 hypothetical protein [Flavobacteriales bacterium]MDP5076318.1 hypothetical protein [Flavobacteriales bacterium]